MAAEGIEYRISSFVKDEILEIVVTGEFTKDSIAKIKNDVFDIENSTKIKKELIDIREFKGRPSITEIYFFARSFSFDRQKINTAFVDITENAEILSFAELTATNIGLSVKWFTDIEAARTWLKSKLSK